MKRRLLDLLSCPVCRDWLELTIFEERDCQVGIAPPAPPCSERCVLRDASLGPGLSVPKIDECVSCYAHEIVTGLLLCNQCGSRYPIVDAVPRLIRNAEHEYRAFFERHGGARRSRAAHSKEVDPGVFDARSNES